MSEQGKKRLAIAAIVIAAGALIMALLGHKVVHTELVIKAPPEAIWKVLTNPGGYAKWNPILVRAEGEYQEGADIRYRMRDESGKESDVVSKVVKIEENRLLNQFGGMRGILTFDHQWRLEPLDGGTRVVQHEEYRGIGVWFWDPSGVKRLYEKANSALQGVVEGSAPP